MEGFFDTDKLTSANDVPSFPLCIRCGLQKQCKSPMLPPVGDGKIPLLLIGDSPTKGDDREGELFSGETGDLLWDALDAAGVAFEDVTAICAHACHTSGKIGKAVEYCRPLVWQEISRVQPIVIVPMGPLALRSVVQLMYKKELNQMDQWVGWKIPWREKQCVICPTYSLSFVLQEKERGSAAELLFREHIKNAVELCLENPDEADTYHPLNLAQRSADWEQSRIVTDPKEIKKVIKQVLALQCPVAFDYETTGLKPYNQEHNIRTVSFACVPYQHEHSGLRGYAFDMDTDPDLMYHFLRILKNRKNVKIAHNLPFEVTWSKVVEGAEVRGTKNWDTMLAAHVLDNRRSGVSLKFLSFVKFGVLPYDIGLEKYLKADKSKEGGNAINRVWDAPKKILLTYNAMDAILTYMLWETQRAEMGYRSSVWHEVKTKEGIADAVPV